MERKREREGSGVETNPPEKGGKCEKRSDEISNEAEFLGREEGMAANTKRNHAD